MFFWISSHGGGRPRVGCCGGLFVLPLAWMLLFGGFGGSSRGWWLLLLAVTVLGAMLLLRGMLAAQAAGEKRKHDDYPDKPKRSERYILSDDGEIIEVGEEDADWDGSEGRRL